MIWFYYKAKRLRQVINIDMWEHKIVQRFSYGINVLYRMLECHDSSFLNRFIPIFLNSITWMGSRTVGNDGFYSFNGTKAFLDKTSKYVKTGSRGDYKSGCVSQNNFYTTQLTPRKILYWSDDLNYFTITQ